jgi:ACS family tartrate transporter-like MFS transporter
MAGVLIAVPLSMVLGGPICGLLLGLDNPFGMAAWRSMFLIMAIPNFVLAVIAGFYFVDRPAKAPFLDNAERQWLQQQLTTPTDKSRNAASLKDIALNPWLWRCSMTWFLIMTGSYALVYWLPQLVRTLPVGDNEFVIASISAIPLLGLTLGLIFNSKHSDRTGERLLHVGLPSAAAGIVMFIAAGFGSGWAVLLLLFVAGFGIGAAQGVFWAIPTLVKLGGEQTPVGAIAFISMLGTAGGIFGPWLIGKILSGGGNFSMAIAFLAALLVIALFVIAYDQFGRNKTRL